MFKKGQSGNPAGRKKGTKNKSVRLAEALSDIGKEKGFDIMKKITADIVDDALAGEELVTVDPSSSAILRIELAESRKAEDWKRHFECL